MKSLREVVQEYKEKSIAVGHFNFSDSNQLKAIAEASKETGLPVIAGLSEGERDYFPLSHARSLIDIYVSQGIQIYLNADHTYSVEKVERAIAAGVNSVVVDGAKLSMEENIHMTAACVKRARGNTSDVVMEGELGYIGASSKQLDSLPEGVTLENLTTPEQAKEFVANTGVDCFAPAVGNVHGMLKNAAEPRLHPERVKAISEAIGLPLVLHGASGNTEADIKACIAAGVAIVHINTELRVMYRDRLYDTIRSNPGEVAPYKFLGPSVDAMKAYIGGKLRLFAGQ